MMECKIKIKTKVGGTEHTITPVTANGLAHPTNNGLVHPSNNGLGHPANGGLVYHPTNSGFGHLTNVTNGFGDPTNTFIKQEVQTPPITPSMGTPFFPHPPPLTPRPSGQASYEIGMRINIRQVGGVAPPQAPEFCGAGGGGGGRRPAGRPGGGGGAEPPFKHETRARIVKQEQHAYTTTTSVRPSPPKKKRRRSASSDSSAASSSSCPGTPPPSPDGCVEIVDETGDGLRSRLVPLNTKRRFRVRDNIDLALALGIPVDELSVEKVEDRCRSIRSKLRKPSHVHLTKFEEFDVHIRSEHYASNVQPDPQFFITQGKPLLDKIEAEMENAQKARAAAGGKAHCSGKTCIFQHGSAFTAERRRKRRGGGPVACYVVKPAAGNRCHFEESLVLPQGTCLLRPLNKLVELVAQAINDSPDGLLQVQQVYTAIQNRFPYFKYMDKSSLTSWRSSIRHALYQRWFRKVRFSTDLISVLGCYWAINRYSEPREWSLPVHRHDLLARGASRRGGGDAVAVTPDNGFRGAAPPVVKSGVPPPTELTEEAGVMWYSDVTAPGPGAQMLPTTTLGSRGARCGVFTLDRPGVGSDPSRYVRSLDGSCGFRSTWSRIRCIDPANASEAGSHVMDVSDNEELIDWDWRGAADSPGPDPMMSQHVEGNPGCSQEPDPFEEAGVLAEEAAPVTLMDLPCHSGEESGVRSLVVCLPVLPPGGAPGGGAGSCAEEASYYPVATSELIETTAPPPHVLPVLIPPFQFASASAHDFTSGGSDLISGSDGDHLDAASMFGGGLEGSDDLDLPASGQEVKVEDDEADPDACGSGRVGAVPGGPGSPPPGRVGEVPGKRPEPSSLEELLQQDDSD